MTWWRVTGTVDGYGGKVFDTPQVVNVRWEDTQEEFRNLKGDLEISNAIVYCPDAAIIKPGDYVYNGDQHTITNPTELIGAFPVKQVVRIPDLRYVRYQKRAML